jgi:hypothetical protein
MQNSPLGVGGLTFSAYDAEMNTYFGGKAGNYKNVR